MLAQAEGQSDVLRRLLESVEVQAERIFLRFGIPAHDAEDILQDSLLAFLSHRDSVLNAEAWLAGTLRNRCFLYWRSRRRQLWEAVDATLLSELAGGVAGGQETTDVRQDLSHAIDRLPKRCRSILQLRYGLDCDGVEIAERLGYRPSSIRQITNRCLAALTVQLVSDGYCEERGAVHEPEPASLG